MRLPAQLREPLVRTARNATLVAAFFTAGFLFVLLATHVAPELLDIDLWWPFEIVGWLIVLLAGLATVESARAWLRPSRHAAIERLAKYGDVGEIVGDIVAELAGPTERHGTATFLASHLIAETSMSYAIFPTDTIVWCHAVETVHRKWYVVTVGRSYEVVLRLRGGETYRFPSSAKDHENVLLCVAQRPGNHLFGHDEALEKEWSRDHLFVTRGIDLLASEGGLSGGPAAALDAAQRAEAMLAVEKARETVARARAGR
jgi:hypothetical protein